MITVDTKVEIDVYPDELTDSELEEFVDEYVRRRGRGVHSDTSLASLESIRVQFLLGKKEKAVEVMKDYIYEMTGLYCE